MQEVEEEREEKERKKNGGGGGNLAQLLQVIAELSSQFKT